MNDLQKPKRWKVIFAGTPAYAVPSFEALVSIPDVEVVGVLTQKAKPRGRGLQPQESPVALRARALGLFVMTPDSLRSPEVQAAIRGLQADAGVVVAYGKILPASLLQNLPLGWVNAHASLLPRWRGASPIQHAILAGDTHTGVTLMQLDAGMDTGPIFATAVLPIGSRTTAAELAEILANQSAQLLAQHLLAYFSGTTVAHPQPATGVTTARKFEASDGRLRWQETAEQLDRTIRACTPWPGTTTRWGELQLKVLAAHAAEGSALPGHVGKYQNGCSIGTGVGLLIPETLQLAGKKPTDIQSFLRGHPTLIGATLA